MAQKIMARRQDIRLLFVAALLAVAGVADYYAVRRSLRY